MIASIIFSNNKVLMKTFLITLILIKAHFKSIKRPGWKAKLNIQQKVKSIFTHTQKICTTHVNSKPTFHDALMIN